MKSRNTKIILMAVIAALVVVFFIFDLGQYLTLDYLKSRQQVFNE